MSQSSTVSEPMTLEEAKGSAKSHRGHYTRNQVSLTRAIADLEANLSSFAVDQVQKLFATFEARKDILENLYNVCLRECEEKDRDVWTTKQGEVSTTLDKARTEVSRVMALAGVVPVPAMQAAPQQSGAGVVKANNTLKPFVLSLDHTPVELRNWVRKFKAFFSTSMFNKSSPEEQQAYVRQFLDPDLDLRIATKVTPMTPVFGDDGIIAEIEEVFTMKYPLMTRRLDYFRYERQSGQSVSAFVAKLTQLGNEADLASLSVDEIMIFRVITGIKEDNLFTKLMEMDNPDFEQVEKKITTWEVAQIAKKSYSEMAGSNKAKKLTQYKKGQQSGKGGKPKGGKPSGGGSGNASMHTPESIRGKCYKCGNPNHKKPDCTRENLVCNTCNKPNHVSTVCLAAFYASKNKATAKQVTNEEENKVSTVTTTPKRS